MVKLKEMEWIDELFYSYLRGTYNEGKILSLRHNELHEREKSYVYVFLTSNQKAQQATLCFIWSSLAQGVLPREIIFKIAKLIWDSRTSPHLWGIFI